MAAPIKTYKSKRHIVLDLETLSTKRNAAVIDIGAQVVDWNQGINDSFQTFVRYQEQGDSQQFHLDQSTVDWHLKIDPNFMDHCEQHGVSFQEAAVNFGDWVRSQGRDVELHLWSQGKDFDFPILENLLSTAGVETPWAYSRVHCLRDLVWLNPASRIKDNGPVAHKALQDAQAEARQLIATVQSSAWLQRLFK